MKKSKLLQGFVLLQPILDIITSLQSVYLDFDLSISILFRGITVLLVSIYLLFQKQNRRMKWYIGLVGFFSIIYLIHMYISKGSSILFTELYSLIRFFYFPILLIFFYELLKKERNTNFVFKNIMVYLCLFYFGISFVAFLTGSSFPSYMGDDKLGFNGWFYSANERGNTYVILLPLLIPLFLKNIKYIWVFLLGLFSLLILGTKVGYLGVVATLLGTLFYLLVHVFIKKENHALNITIFSILLLFIIGITPFLPVYKNIEIQNHELINIINEKEHLSTDILEEKIKENDAYLIEDKNQNIVFSGREVFLKQNIEYFRHQGIISKLFGVGFENKYLGDLEIANKVEIDIFDTFFAFGLFGFLLYWSPFLYFSFLILVILLRKYKMILNPNINFALLSIGLAVIISMISGHIFVAPSVSIYVTLILLTLYFELEKGADPLKKVLFISSTGGHLSELLQLKELFKKYDYHIITEKTKSNLELAIEYPNRVNYLVYGTKSHVWSYIYKFPYNILKSLYLYIKIRPKVIITTGTHTAVPMCYIGKLFGSKIIYIETFANIHTKTLTGRMIYPIADQFIVQWESMLKLYPKAKFGGWIY